MLEQHLGKETELYFVEVGENIKKKKKTQAREEL